MHRDAMQTSFAHEVIAALRRACSTPPAADEAQVLWFDSAPWWPLLDEAETLLTPHEQARAKRFRHAHDHHTYVLAHACWRIALGVALDRDSADVELISAANGQPLLPGTSFATSLSHSGSHVAIAIARASTLGVDIERSPPRATLHELMALVCTPSEVRALQALPDDARTHALLALWTRKEALLKAFGVGLRTAPSTIEADPFLAIDPPLSAPDMPACRVRPLDLPEGLVGALAFPLSVTRVSLHALAPFRWINGSYCLSA